MTLPEILQTAVVLLAAATPWLVVEIAHRQARAHVKNSAAALAATRPAVGLDWTTRTSACLLLTLAGAILGVIGCAHALASGLTTRRYQVAR